MRLRTATTILLVWFGGVFLYSDHLGAQESGERDGVQTPKSTPTPPPEEIEPGDVIRITTNLVAVPVRVLDKKGKYISDVRAEEFQIFEEGVEQRIAFFAPVESPFTVLLMLDISESTEGSLQDIKDAAFSFISQLRRDDLIIIITFDGRLNVLAQPTSDREELRKLLDSIKPGGGTRIYDAVDLIGKRLVPQIKGRKAIVLFTDGVDIDSRATAPQSLKRMEESDAVIYCIQYDTYAAMADKIRKANSSLPRPTLAVERGSRPEDYALARNYLHRLSDRTGGRRYEAGNPRQMLSAFAMIGEELHWHYSVGYYPSSPGQPGERRRIKVRVARRVAVVHARESYIYKRDSDSKGSEPEFD